MLENVFVKSVRDHRKGLLGFGLGLIAMASAVCARLLDAARRERASRVRTVARATLATLWHT